MKRTQATPLLSGVAAGQPVSGEELSPPWPRRGGRAINKMLRRHLLWERPGWLVQKVASRLFLDRAATPPRLRRGVLYVLFLAVAAASVFAAQRQQQPDNSPIPPILQKYQPVTAERL